MREASRERGHGRCRLPPRPPLPEEKDRHEAAGDHKRGDDEAGPPGKSHGTALLQRRDQEHDGPQEQERAEDVGLPEEVDSGCHDAPSA